MKKVISFSLWGDDPKYTIGAIRNAELSKTIYPGWIPRFYCAKNSVPENIISQLRELNSEIVIKDTVGDWTGMFWRFQTISDPEVEVMISRDTDSRISLREKLAVDEWLKSGKLFHIMRDHPAHGTQILGGMWGAKKPILQDMNYLINAYDKKNFWQIDQNFLRDVIYPRVSYTTCVHDEFFEKKRFPSKRKGLEFIGQVYDCMDNSTVIYEKDLEKYLNETRQNHSCSR